MRAARMPRMRCSEGTAADPHFLAVHCAPSPAERYAEALVAAEADNDTLRVVEVLTEVGACTSGARRQAGDIPELQTCLYLMCHEALM